MKISGAITGKRNILRRDICYGKKFFDLCGRP
jgi:hypothetical protein